jgi:type I restriction enzyme R subunit
LCDDINKDKFTIFDCFDGSLIEYFKNATDFDVTLQKETLLISEIIERVYDNRDREYNINVLIKRLRRIEKNMGSEARDQFSKFIEDGDLKAYADKLRENLTMNFTKTMELLRNKDFQDLLVNYKRPEKVFFKGYDVVDTVEDGVVFCVGDEYQKPEDYLKSFERFVKENPEHITAIEILLSKPKNWNTDALDELRNKLKRSDYDEHNLQKAHRQVYKKPLADIISIIKHAADSQKPIFNAEERVNYVLENFMAGKEFTEEQQKWLSYIREHLIENLALAEDDFKIMPVFERHGGIDIAKRVFGEDFNTLIDELNTALAA